MLLNMAESGEQNSESADTFPKSHARVYNGLVNLVDAEGSFPTMNDIRRNMEAAVKA